MRPGTGHSLAVASNNDPGPNSFFPFGCALVRALLLLDEWWDAIARGLFASKRDTSGPRSIDWFSAKHLAVPGRPGLPTRSLPAARKSWLDLARRLVPIWCQRRQNG
jgi:hypothetical protein